jgi:deoxyribodipyrimidine photo-lyase
MWFASIWTHTLGLPWTLGADFFLRHLLDGDPASNTLSWRWVVGLHTRGKVYLARPDNIARYTDGRFPRPRGLAVHAEPLVAATEEPARPWQAPTGRFEPRGRVGVLVLDDDVSPLPLDVPVAAAAGLLTGQRRSPLDTPPRVLEFARGAVQEALAAVPAEAAGPPPLHDSVEAVVAWARRHDLDTVVCRYPTVGPAADQAARLARGLEAHGIGWQTALSAYDRRCWPHTARGFFALKKQMPRLLDELAHNVEPIGQRPGEDRDEW